MTARIYFFFLSASQVPEAQMRNRVNHGLRITVLIVDDSYLLFAIRIQNLNSRNILGYFSVQGTCNLIGEAA